MTEARSSMDMIKRLAVLEGELENAFMIISALVIKYGEDSAQGDRVARLTDAELVDVRREKPTVYRVDDPGEIVFRVRP